MAQPCNPKWSSLFKEIATLAVLRGPCLRNTLSMAAWSFVDGPRRPWPSLWRYSSGASKGGHYIGTHGGAMMSPLRHPAKAMVPRPLIVVSIRLA
jgi:hypothetical protein